jgi:hypothetical protein
MKSLSPLLLASVLVVAACGDSGKKKDEVFDGQVGTLLFVTQVPIGGLGSVVGSFNNHLGDIESVLRGGDLMLRYPDGQLRNLTREAGFGDAAEFQGENGIAVREPTVHWSGNRALFSMVIGGALDQFDRSVRHRWQIYEVDGLAQGETATIRKIAGQPEDFNNVSAIYGSDDAILFASDRPRNGEMHHYPPLDEYESMPSNVGIYRLYEEGQSLTLIEHSPSGVFNLSLDSHGRVLFTKWDHLQRDQQGDSESVAQDFRPVTHADESASAATTSSLEGAESFPEARTESDPGYDSAIEPHRFNQFFVWEVNQDGSEEETLNHVGRQEWGGSFTEGSIVDDSALTFRAPNLQSKNQLLLPDDGGAFQVRQDPVEPIWYVATSAQEFATGTAGQIVLLEGDPSVNPEDMRVLPLTPHPEEASVPDDTGYFRNPLRMTNGTYLAVHTDASGNLVNNGSREAPDWNYNFRIKVLEPDGERFRAGANLTEGIQRSLQWWTPDESASWSGTLWELDVVEVAPRERPPMRASVLPEIEQAIFDEVGVNPAELRTWLADRDLAMLVSRNMTARDRNDVQQPYRLTVPNGVSSAGSNPGYDVEHIQFFQADYVRSYGNNIAAGRRVLARAMHGPDLITDSSGPEGSVAIGLDGSMAAFVPARRAMAWQLVAPDQSAVVRERNWVSFGSGEIRVCASCHGINKETHDGQGLPENPPEALRSLLQTWKAL